MGAHKNLNDHQADIVYRYKTKRQSGKEIGDIYGCEKGAIYRALKRWGVEARWSKHSDDLYEMALAKYYNDESYEKIMSDLNIHQSKKRFIECLRRYRMRKGYKARTKIRYMEMVEDLGIIKELLKDLPIVEVASKYGVSHHTLVRVLEKYDVLPEATDPMQHLNLTDLYKGAWRHIDEKALILINRRPAFYLVPYTTKV